ncbi:predicted protein [Naegleria gruberi]|uniref:Predicted protein n=1 Tax=Naegleria gruberi TaxID=5762 RepID=D2VEP5_NAEGR|nr:uncharacterized protein NAEGRDRAFT_67346 [Naegleria gruberi]EFC44542.1 predicted protein [Naegleria gruberi]|eukprot:XP_002677286.1 predicted protein [Naegleria gruberi strain NEG-M]
MWLLVETQQFVINNSEDISEPTPSDSSSIAIIPSATSSNITNTSGDDNNQQQHQESITSSSSSSSSSTIILNNSFLHEAPLNVNLTELNSALSRIVKGRHVLFSCFEYLLSNQLIKKAKDEQELKEKESILYNELFPIFQNCCDKSFIISHKIPITPQIIHEEKTNLKKICEKHLNSNNFITLCKLIDAIEKNTDYIHSITCFNGKKSLSHSDYKKYDDLRRVFATDNEKTKINIKIEIKLNTPVHIHLTKCEFAPPLIENKKRKARQLTNLEEEMLSNNDENGSFFHIKKKKVEKYGPRRLKIPDDLAIKKEQLEYIGESSMLKNRLKNERLQKMLLEVDANYDREQVLDFFLETEPEFLIFCEELLYIMGRRDDNDLKQIHEVNAKYEQMKQNKQ